MVQKNSLKPKIIIICGPTASGKTALAVEVAKKLNSEVISADSMYIYKGLNIGTAKPDEMEMQGVKHHMIDVVNADENFTVSDYKNLAEPILKNLINEGKIPIICGGTGFYINSLLYDLSYGNGNDNAEVREKYKKLAQQNGNEFVYNILKEVDPESAQKLHYNDLKRVIRALEIYENGCKKSDIKDDFTPKYDYLAYTINHPREVLYERINSRVDIMVKGGLIDEIKGLLNSGIDRSNQCMQGIGYKEILEYFDGNITLDQAIETIKLNTRHYAKRQITFFKRIDGLINLDPSSIENMTATILKDFTND
ncbi:MAG: tRNA (adenosine(37)-N6)-dimethylallyltransferase MiaA [Clostridiales bacterium]|nr:tRNA (adenosine(37)-N6)-dimethylallyltransferase MiaA [Clostridiales bacterium]